MVLAKHTNRARLRPLLALLFNKNDRRPYREIIERIIQHTRAVEIETLLTRLDESVSVGPRELDHFTV